MLFRSAAVLFFSWLSSLFHDKVILINTADNRAARWFIPERKLALINNGIGPIDFFPREEARAFFAEKIGRPIAPHTYLVGTNAELTRNKGIHHLISASGSCAREALTLIIGEGHERSSLEHSLEKTGLQNAVHLLGFIPDAARYLKGLDIFVLPSLKEGLPYTIMEAMAAGLPVISTQVGGIPDLVEHRKNGLLVRPKDPPALAAALRTLMTQEELKAELSQASPGKIKSKFGLAQMIQNTIALYV